MLVIALRKNRTEVSNPVKNIPMSANDPIWHNSNLNAPKSGTKDCCCFLHKKSVYKVKKTFGNKLNKSFQTE